MDKVDTIQLENNVRVEIFYDTEPFHPRQECDNLGTMVCFHRRYNLGDKNVKGKEQFDSPDDFREWIAENPSIILPLYLYDHSGLSISTGGFSDPWDSGQVGWIFVTYEDIKKEYGWKYITSKRAKQIKTYLEGEVETYDQFLRGDVYYFTAICNNCEEELDSCGGFYGSNWKENGLLWHVGTPECENCKTLQNRLDQIVVAEV